VCMTIHIQEAFLCFRSNDYFWQMLWNSSLLKSSISLRDLTSSLGLGSITAICDGHCGEGNVLGLHCLRIDVGVS